MSEEIDLDANNPSNLTISEDAFEKFQSATLHDEDEFITLSDIVPPQPSAPDLSQELNEIPYDNEVVLGSPQNYENQVNNTNHDTESQFLDISQNNLNRNTSAVDHDDNVCVDMEISDTPKQQKIMDYYERQDLSSDGLGAQNYIFEDGTSIIQDSLLSTTVNHSDSVIETHSETVEESNGLRRTKRGRIPNTSKYPMTSTTDSNSNKSSTGKRRPGRPKKGTVTQPPLEPDSTNNDNTSLLSETRGLNEPSSDVKRGRRGRPKASLTEESTPTPNKRGRKPKATSNDGLSNSCSDENTLVESSKQDVDLQMDLDSPLLNNDENSLTLSTSKRKKQVSKRGKKKIYESTNKSDNVTPCNNNMIVSDDDADDVSLSQIKQGLKEPEAVPDSNTDMVMNVDQNNMEEKASDGQNNKISDEVHTETQAELTSDVQSAAEPTVVIEAIPNNGDLEDIDDSSNKRSSKMPIMSDFEYNVDKVVKEATADSQSDGPDENECLLVEDTSKRRRTVKKTFVYDEGSDEDPFANVESSEDESPRRRKKGKKYYSDDEYVPIAEDRKKGGGKIPSSSSESEDGFNDDLDDLVKTKKKNFGVSPFKKGRKPKSQVSPIVTQPADCKTIISTIVPKAEVDDIEECLQTTMIKVDESLKPPGEAWATSNEFENFIAQKTQGTSLKIKKVSSKEKTETLAPLDIPVIKQNEPKKTTEISTQTVKASTSSSSSQTSAPYDIPMKLNIDLTPAQSEKACEFLTSVVKTTVELGQLMSQKSDDFMKKKINTEHVTDTFKMDYCVRKSFLLFKLAKHNLLQMEEDLAKQYEAFLNENKLTACREQPKNIAPKAKVDSDSDCEIVEVMPNTDSKIKQEKPKFNPKTVFLNKELSIKIAKKPFVPTKPTPGKKKLEIKGRHAVWINKNVMVKKVSPSQSFLAQDSRNKKPPDTYVTEKMVSDFFEDYNRLKALCVCAPFINSNWTHVRREYACYYFVNELDAANTSRNINDLSVGPAENSNATPDENSNFNEISNIVNPKSLCALCFDAISKILQVKNQAQTTQKITCDVTDGTDTKGPVTLFRLCINALGADNSNQYKTQKDAETIEGNSYCDLPHHQNKESAANMIEEINGCDQYDTQESSNNEEYDIDHDMSFQYNIKVLEGVTIHKDVLPLTSICYQQVVKMLYESETFPNQYKLYINKVSSLDCCPNENEQIHEEVNMSCQSDEEDTISDDISHSKNGFKSLSILCLELIQKLQGFPKNSTAHTSISSPWCPNVCKPKSLKSIAFKNIKQLIHPNIEESGNSAIITETNNGNDAMENFTINCVNTLTEEAFQSLQVPMGIRIRKQSQNSSNFSDEYDNDGCGLDEMDFNADLEEDNGWASQLQVHEFRSCTPVQATENTITERNEPPQNEEPLQIIPNIKSEPIDYFAEDNIVDTSIVKSEPIQQTLHALNEMTHIPDNIVTKKELIEASIDRVNSPLVRSSSSYNVETFEEFVRSNKMIQSMDETNNEIFSQSALRIRKQHEPDIDQGNDMSMSLLVPHTFEPLNLVEAKGSLMESSSDESGGNYKKNAGKKKDKRKKKQKKDTKAANNKDTSAAKQQDSNKDKEKTVSDNELAVLTRKMRDKIRQEEKKIVSSDSDSENLYMFSSKKDKSKKNKTDLSAQSTESSGSETFYLLSANKNDSKKDSNKIKPKNKHASAEHTKETKQKDDEVQCNNVDSTEMFNDSANKESEKSVQFSGFTAIDQNEITNYQKLMQFVYDKIIPTDSEDNKSTKESPSANLNDTSLVFNPDDPVELLECEPTMPMFDNASIELPGPKRSKKNKKKTEIVNNEPQFIERNGWHCYPINSKETKLYKKVKILLEKLPESFVQTYMEYQDVMDKDLEDEEVDRLTNLQSLNRSISVNIKDGKTKSRPKGSGKETASGQNSENISNAPSPTFSDNFDELARSDDEGPAVEDEIPPPMPARSSENNLAKNLLMGDHDSDSDGAGGKKIKHELKDPDDKTEKSKKAGLKSKNIANNVESGSLMLTADKMMNKELNLLHAPVLLQEHVPGTSAKGTSPKEDNKSNKKSSSRHSKDRVKNEDDSSSEEEKQWVSTKEKLLKRMGKKEDAVADDAKRAKLVNEFIERRNESERKNKRESHLGRKGRMRRKALERQKQLRFLSNELYNEGDGIVGGKRGAAAGLFKGRRNIRKVIDKKSLARSTVVANMEEFERKRRLNMRQNKLREVLGCEEGVNVLVINDEVCLEYDFVEQRPVVTVHQFFTKVMKAHQYEGVKFMWDACFESLARIESGHGGGGCILAHCMGLGKTLQVLALLHTVLTHPRANMHRVLVCCPLSTVLNWVDEIHKWIGPVTNDIKVFELSKLRKTYERAYQLEDWYNGGGIFIIGYELFRSLTTLDPEIDEIRPTIINKIRNALLDPGPDIIVCDEGHLLKNDCSVLAVAMSRVVTKRRIVLTGTPMQNNLREYFCMVNFIKPNLLGTYSEYSNRFENPIMNGQHRDSVEEDIKLMKARTHILHKVLEGCLQRQEASVLYPYLPKKHEYTVFIPLTKCQWDLYHHYMDNYAKTSKQSVLRDFHILQKIWSHPQVLHSFQMKARDKKDKIKAEKIEDDLALADQEADIKPAETEVWWLQYLCEGAMLDSLDSSNKFVAVFRILHECVALGDKILIFSTSLFCLDALEYFLKKINKWSLGQEYFRLDGSVPAEVRQKWCREFNAENNVKTQLFLISTRAGCLGLNMTAANRVIILDTSWNPAHDIQSIFRVYRFGQKKDCYIYRLVALGTMEQKIYERSVTKQAVACRVVDEQQIDRHYNLAELTELYSVDEFGLTVAGGVAVGVNDVALLRVARDAAIHAVHEHDSLLRGSGEQGLPEHERAAAWNQFQQEHEHKQMQNELKANKAVVALKRLEMKHLRQQALYSKATEVPPIETNVKVEPATEYPLLVPMEETEHFKNKGKRGKITKIVQCRIPIASTPQAGPSLPLEPEDQNELVKKITTLLIKHNFMQKKSGPKQISDLVAKVRKMVATRQPIALGPGYDELSSSIAEVLLHSNVTMPALTDVEEPKQKLAPKKLVEPEPEIQPVPEQKTDGRKRRKAALAAEMQFDSQQDIIDLDDSDDWQNDEIVPDEIPEPVIEPTPAKEKTAKQKEKPKEIDSSIVLSDDDGTPEVIDTAPKTVSSEESEDTEVVALHPSLLTNSNFIKIVAHTYLAGNPMMDEDAATLAAQYSTLKTLKEAESEGKPIVGGAVYDIAVKVLGTKVLRKLQAANPKTSSESSVASNQLQSFLTENSAPETPAQVKPAPTPAPKKPKIGPKSKVAKGVQEPKNIPTTSSAISKNVKTEKSYFIAPREESILPDEEVIIEPPPEPVDRKPIFLRKVKLERKIMSKIAATPVSLGRGPAPQTPPDATICLDSDDEEPTTPMKPLRRITVKVPTSAPAPVPVALMGPNARPIPLPPPALTPIAEPRYFTLSACGTRAIPISGPQPIPLMAGNGAQPVPVTLLGPGTVPQPVMMSFGASGMPVPTSEPVPVSLVGPDSRPIPIVLSGPSAPPPQPSKSIESISRSVAFVGGQSPLTLRFSTQQMTPQSSREIQKPSETHSAVAPPRPRAAAPRKPAQPGDTLKIMKNNKTVILNNQLGNSEQVSYSVADDPPRPHAPAKPTVAPTKPTAAVAKPSVPAKPQASTRPASPVRRLSSSSSSSSSRSSSPDPLAILKDVVHIQAPNVSNKTPQKPAQKPPPQKQLPQKPQTQKQLPQKPQTQKQLPQKTKPSNQYGEAKTMKLSTASINPKPEMKAKGKPISASVDLTTLDSLRKTNTSAKKPFSLSFDLTDMPDNAGSSKVTPKANLRSGSFRTDSKTNIKGKNNPPPISTKLVGTSKSIILDGKSKTLKVDSKNTGASMQVLSSKTLASGSKQKPADKRPAPSLSAPAPKKKKTELMTLKDFDIDDIDDIIELD